MLEGITLEDIRNMLAVFGNNPYTQAAVVILGSLVLAKISSWLITRVLLRLARRTRSSLDDQFIRLLQKPVSTTVILVGLLIGFLILEPPEAPKNVCKSLIGTLIVILWTSFGVRSISLFILSLSRSERFRVFQPATRPLFETGSKLVLIALCIYFILISWGVNPVGWLATAGIGAVAIGLAAQDTLGNLFAGISILADAPYKIDDFIVLDGKERGKVTKIGLRSTRILTRDDLEITIPNSTIATSKIVNETAGRWIKQRLRIPVGVAYGTEPDLVKALLKKAAATQKGVCSDPSPWVKFDSFGDSSLNFEIRCWIEDPALRGRVVDAINTAVAKTLVERNIEIPFPKRDLYIKELPGSLRSERTEPAREEGSRRSDP